MKRAIEIQQLKARIEQLQTTNAIHRQTLDSLLNEQHQELLVNPSYSPRNLKVNIVQISYAKWWQYLMICVKF